MKRRSGWPTEKDPAQRTFKGTCTLALGNYQSQDIVETVVRTLKVEHGKDVKVGEDRITFKGHSLPVLQWTPHDLIIYGERKGSQLVAWIVTDFMGLVCPNEEEYLPPTEVNQDWLFKGPSYASSSISGATKNNGEFKFTRGSDTVLHKWLSIDVLMDWTQNTLSSPFIEAEEGLYRCTVKGRHGKLRLQWTAGRGVVQITGNVEERRERLVNPIIALIRSWGEDVNQEVTSLLVS